MRRLALLILIVAPLTADTSAANVLNNGGFETPAAWADSTASLTVNDGNASKWWIDPEVDTWILQNLPGYASEGTYCAGDVDGFGRFGGLVQFVPSNGEHAIQLTLDYLLWRGDWGDTVMTYAVYGWQENDIIDMSSSGPGAAAFKILGGTLDSPYYPGGGNPGDNYETLSCSGSISPGQFKYIGVWIQYELVGGSFYMDDVHLNLSPEPGIVGLMGLGSLILFLRRRR